MRILNIKSILIQKWGPKFTETGYDWHPSWNNCMPCKLHACAIFGQIPCAYIWPSNFSVHSIWPRCLDFRNASTIKWGVSKDKELDEFYIILDFLYVLKKWWPRNSKAWKLLILFDFASICIYTATCKRSKRFEQLLFFLWHPSVQPDSHMMFCVSVSGQLAKHTH